MKKMLSILQIDMKKLILAFLTYIFILPSVTHADRLLTGFHPPRSGSPFSSTGAGTRVSPETMDELIREFKNPPLNISNEDMGVSEGKPVPPEPTKLLEVFFDVNSAELNEVAKVQLRAVRQRLNSIEYKDKKIKIEGYADTDNDEPANINLSSRRANNVKSFLNEQYGISNELLEIVEAANDTSAVPLNPSDGKHLVRIVFLGQ